MLWFLHSSFAWCFCLLFHKIRGLLPQCHVVNTQRSHQPNVLLNRWAELLNEQTAVGTDSLRELVLDSLPKLACWKVSMTYKIMASFLSNRYWCYVWWGHVAQEPQVADHCLRTFWLATLCCTALWCFCSFRLISLWLSAQSGEDTRWSSHPLE